MTSKKHPLAPLLDEILRGGVKRFADDAKNAIATAIIKRAADELSGVNLIKDSVDEQRRELIESLRSALYAPFYSQEYDPEKPTHGNRTLNENVRERIRCAARLALQKSPEECQTKGGRPCAAKTARLICKLSEYYFGQKTHHKLLKT